MAGSSGMYACHEVCAHLATERTADSFGGFDH